MTAKYKEHTGSYRLQRNILTGIDGQRAYRRCDNVPDAGDTLPTLGTTPMVDQESGATYASCVPVAYELTYPEGDPTAATIRYTFSAGQMSGGGAGVSNNPADRRIQTGVEIVSRKADGFWWWKSDAAAVKDMDISRHVFTASFTIPVVIANEDKAAYITSSIVPNAGKINGASFDGWPIGCVLFDGLTGGTRIDKDGDVEWAFDLNFQVKLIADVTVDGVVGKNSWQHAFRGSAGVLWDIPNTSPSGSGDMLYTTVDLNALMPT
jgi:hypothetical protein